MMKTSHKEKSPSFMFQFMITLLEVEPLVWRRIHVPGTYTFWDLHVAIQDAMGWTDSHLHEFKLPDPDSGKQVRIDIPLNDPDREDALPDNLTMISDYFNHYNPVSLYTYDYGDEWRHVVTFEGIVPPEPGIRYPQCISGERKCPPEDCGGAHGYELFLEAIRDPDHEEHEEYLTWVGGSFDPSTFDPGQVSFDDPGERWTNAFTEP